MIREKTTFVIGSGASAEFGLPVGSQLAAEIKKSANLKSSDTSSSFSGYMRDFLFQKFRLEGERKEFGKALRDIHEGIHTAVSIDAFIHRHRASEKINRLGKALIALEVLKAENESSMSADRWSLFQSDPDALFEGKFGEVRNPDYTWIGHFFRMLCDGIEDPREVGNNVKIVCFNYDRCIEHYLVESLSAAYRIGTAEALDIVENRMTIIHPYGYLGRLAPAINGKSDDRISFGYDMALLMDIEEISGNIQTYTEQSHDVDKVESIHEAVADCRNLVFLGFGFNNQNLDLLRVKHTFLGDAHPKNIYATGFGLYQQIDDTLKRRIVDLFLDERDPRGSWINRVHVEYDKGCRDLFRIHDMNLTSFRQRVLVIDDEHGERRSRLEPYKNRIA